MSKNSQDNGLLNFSELSRRVRAVAEVVQWWRTSSGSLAPYRGREVKAISQEVFEALDKLARIGAMQNDAFHEAARALALAITDFAKAWVLYTDRVQAGDDVTPGGDSSVWNTFDLVVQACDKPSFRHPEPIQQLIHQDKVEAWQVAKIYGWLDDRGNPDPRMVQEELDKPGTHYDPKTWKHPAQKLLEAEVAAKWSTRTPAVVPESLEEIEEAAAQSQIAPESLDTLISQKVSIDQICAMKQVDRETVERRASELGVVLADARHIYPASPQVAIEETMMREENNKAEFEAMQKEQARARKEAIAARIKELQSSGKSKEEVQQAIAAEFPA